MTNFSEVKRGGLDLAELHEMHKKQRFVASVSFGKDSLAMLLRLLEEKWPLDEVVFYNTGMEFNAIYKIRDQVKKMLGEYQIQFTELKPDYDFEWKMFDKPVAERGGGTHYGYSWCGGRCRWGTRDKINAVSKYCKGTIQYIGIAADEAHRFEKEQREGKLLPLVHWGMTEDKCLTYCYDHGFDWVEDGGAGEVSLYYVLDRVSCWCCCNKNLKELKNIYLYMPEYWDRLRDLQAKTERPMKGVGKSVFDLEKRFAKEISEE